jgi:ArsR family transcriptional regulator
MGHRQGWREREPDRVEENYSTDHDYLELKRTLRALGDVVRLHIVHVLSSCAEITVTDLTQMLAATGRPVSQPLVSWHLAMLRRATLVTTRRVGRLVYCSLDQDRYQRCLRQLGDLVAAPPSRGLSVAPAAPVEPAPTVADARGARR